MYAVAIQVTTKIGARSLRISTGEGRRREDLRRSGNDLRQTAGCPSKSVGRERFKRALLRQARVKVFDP
jgi:hypothetical protein